MDERKRISSRQNLMSKWQMITEPLLPSNYAHLMAVADIKGLRINGHY